LSAELPRRGIAVLDFGGQYAQLIARRVRECGVFSQIFPHDVPWEEVAAAAPVGVILSGGPDSVVSAGALDVDPALWDAGVPVLGICYGAQLMAARLGGEVAQSARAQYGPARLQVRSASILLADFGEEEEVWMSHSDEIVSPPSGAVVTASAEEVVVAAFEDLANGRFGVQFHPEVSHTPKGKALLERFLFDVCGATRSWNRSQMVSLAIDEVRRAVGSGRAICALSGGVDSAVAAAVGIRALGDRLTCVFVDTGLMRKGEGEAVREAFRENFGAELIYVEAAERFLAGLAGLVDPEAKRKVIGETFIRIFEEVAAEHPDATHLIQGTLYSDVVESGGGKAARIKSHHNVGALPEDMKLELVEPLRYLFKDEVRAVGEELGLPPSLVWRQPFPGPGLAVRIVGEVSRDRIEMVRAADAILAEEVAAAGLERALWQAFCVLLGLRSVGVQGDRRTYAHPVVIRAVHSQDAMTADFARLPWELLERVSARIVNEVAGVNRVVYDITPKPPGTIEWE
jgi:GMP synthase (glutamine-hydrolysing)